MNTKTIHRTAIGVACGLFFALPVHSHHSNSAYDMEGTMTISGVVSRLQWRNPHVIVRLDVEDEDGNVSQWSLESAGIARLVRDGWSRELLAPGQRLTAEIRPTKQGIPGGILRWITLEDGRVLAAESGAPESAATEATLATVVDPLADAPSAAAVEGGGASVTEQGTLQERAALSLENYLARRTAVEAQEASNRPEQLPKVTPGGATAALDPENLTRHEGVALFDFTGIWQHRSFRELSAQRGGAPWEFLPVPELTPKAAAIQEDILARRAAGDATADPATFCYPHGLQRSMTRNGNMMLLQVDTAVFMVHRMNNDFRAVYWDGRDHLDPNTRVDTYNGDSIAFWADDHLYVETVGFGSPFHYINPGIPMGPQARVEERWRLVNDGNTLEIEFRMTDPEHWVGQWIDTKFWDRIHGADIREANCIVAEDAELAIGGR